MNPFGVVLVIGLIGLLVLGTMFTVSACRDSFENVLAGTIVSMGVDVRETQRTVTIPACPACPGSQPRQEVRVTTDESRYVVVAALEDGEPVELKIGITRKQYEELEVGQTLQIRLTRSTRDGRLCSQPVLVMGGAGG